VSSQLAMACWKSPIFIKKFTFWWGDHFRESVFCYWNSLSLVLRKHFFAVSNDSYFPRSSEWCSAFQFFRGWNRETKMNWSHPSNTKYSPRNLPSGYLT
jgi:hypothetical protein